MISFLTGGAPVIIFTALASPGELLAIWDVMHHGCAWIINILSILPATLYISFIVSSILDETSGKVYEDKELYSFLVENNF